MAARSAESTQAFEKLEPFQDPNAIPTVVVYERDGGLTQDDLAAVEEDAAGSSPTLEGVERRASHRARSPSEDGRSRRPW